VSPYLAPVLVYREVGEGRGEREKGEGRGKREEGRRKREEGSGKREVGRGKREEENNSGRYLYSHPRKIEHHPE
jgi:hypothetical protein